MISRYQRDEMKTIWSESFQYDCYLKVELANAYAWMKDGLFDNKTFDQLLKASVHPSRVLEIEKETRHDVVAFVKAVSETLGEEKKWLHYGLTSTDVVDTANAIRLKKANQIILGDMDIFMAVLKEKAYLYKDMPIMGRTHGIHAEIMPFGMKYALWYEDFKRLRNKFLLAAKEVEVIKLSGAIGTYSTSHPGIQREAANYLNLEESVITTQTLQRDRHAYYISVIALIGAELEKIATEIRHLSRTEVKEVQEAFRKNQKGSSAMPHKKNPILSENICGLSRILKGYVTMAFDNIALWHERDISHSSTERIMLPDATSLIDFMLNRYSNTLKNLLVFPDNMEKNIERSKGLYATQQILNALVDKGYDRLSIHDHLQRLSRIVEDRDLHLKQVIIDDDLLKGVLSMDALNHIFDYKKVRKHIDKIYARVFDD